MDHSFTPSQLDKLKCVRCKYDEISHTERATCECCSNSGTMTIFTDMLMCRECIEKEMNLAREYQSIDKQDARSESYKQASTVALEMSREIDAAIKVRTDLFNAATVSIVDLKSAIESDTSIENKNYALAAELKLRFDHFKDVIFKAQESIAEAANNQKAIQVYLNQLANTLRADEREKLKIADISYKPNTVKPVKIAAIKTTAKKLDKAELRKYASELGISEFILQTIVVSKGVTVEVAANMLRKSIAEAKSEA